MDVNDNCMFWLTVEKINNLLFFFLYVFSTQIFNVIFSYLYIYKLDNMLLRKVDKTYLTKLIYECSKFSKSRGIQVISL